jgi:uncharacterized protein (UPF0303 family)
MNQLIVEKFTAQDAWDLGQTLYMFGQDLDKPVAFEIYAYGQVLFRYSFGGLNPDKDLWLMRKRNTAIHFATSSLAMEEKMAREATSLKKKYGLANESFVAVGGSIPLVIESAGVIGAVTVTGLKPQEDHQVVEDAFEAYLNA